jgi:hypothetical protein
MAQTPHAISITEDGSTQGGFALIDFGRKISRSPIMLSFRRVDGKPRYLGPKGWHREVCWWEAERIGESDLSTIVRVGPAVVDRISELDPIEIAIRGEPDSFPIVNWPALMLSPAGLGQVALLLPGSGPIAEQILPEFETHLLESLSRELGISSKPDKPDSSIDRTTPMAQSTRRALAPAQKHQKLTANTGILGWLSPTSAAALLAVLASLSAILSAYASPGIIHAPYFDVPLLPAVYFGFVLCAGVYLWNSKSKLHLVAVFVATIIAWTCAFKGAVSVYVWSGELLCHSLLSCPFGIETALKAASGLVGGFIGSLSILIAMVFISRDFRNRTVLTRILGIGTIGGLMLVGVKLNASLDLLPLFLVWQPAIAASIAHTLARPHSHPIAAIGRQHLSDRMS